MALSPSVAVSVGGPCPVSPAVAPGRANDAFSFWKLPEQWRESLAASIAASARTIESYLFEEYLTEGDRRPPPGLGAYYRIKRLIPAALRHHMNALVIRARGRRDFPRWPCESALLEYWRDWLRASLEWMGCDDAWHIAFWPEGRRCCVVLTHDVESPLGIERMEQMAELEERYGFRSAWNLPLAQYEIDWNRMDKLRARGFEFGAHGLSHDGRLFRSREDFAKLAPIIERVAVERDLRGFRSPSTLRRAEWIGTMSFDFDCSFSDTDPYEPQPGGTCSIFPFFLGDLVELPYTLPQDHTLIHLLGRSPLPIWTAKAQWIASVGGMILTLTHPDYSGAEPYLSEYEEVLKRLAEWEQSWRALPSEAAAWWRQRAQLRLTMEAGRPVVSGAGSERASVRRLSEEPLSALGDLLCSER